ncbi:MAG TPA: alpha/beta hydrolase-fold protein [Steroidobacteraceae bacterium]
MSDDASPIRLGGTAVAVFGLLVAYCAHAQAPGLKAGANTENSTAPFFIDLGGLDFKTTPPTRDPRNPQYPAATELPDGVPPGSNAQGNFIIGPTHKPGPETLNEDVPKGQVITFTMSSRESVIYSPGMVRDGSLKSAPTVSYDPSNLIVSASRPGTWTRSISVYLSKQLSRSGPAPFLIVGDGGWLDATIFTVLDNLIAQKKLPPMIAITIGAGGQDAQGSERGFEYDTVSGTYAEFVEREVLPLVERKTGVNLSHDPDARATMGFSSSGAAAFSMAWFRPDLYRRVLAYSPTMVNQQWPHSPALRGGAWEYHSPWAGPKDGAVLNAKGFEAPTPTDMAVASPLIEKSAPKPIRVWFEVGDRDLWYPIGSMDDGMHDWVLASENMAKVLAAKAYAYQFIFSRDAGHVDQPTFYQTLGAALQWVWAGYRPSEDAGVAKRRAVQ